MISIKTFLRPCPVLRVLPFALYRSQGYIILRLNCAAFSIRMKIIHSTSFVQLFFCFRKQAWCDSQLKSCEESLKRLTIKHIPYKVERNEENANVQPISLSGIPIAIKTGLPSAVPMTYAG